LKAGFARARYGSLMISSYTTGQIGFLLCEKTPSAASTADHVTKRWNAIQSTGRGTTYYQPKLQKSSFDLPLWVEDALYGTRDVSRDEL
jgi:spermidine synthase